MGKDRVHLFSGYMSKVLFCNSLEMSHTKEVFLLIFRFTAPDGDEEAVYVALPPSGAITLHEMLEREVQSYSDMTLERWEMKNNDDRKTSSYLL